MKNHYMVTCKPICKINDLKKIQVVCIWYVVFHVVKEN